ncbi:hypothetical protein, partial [uncultured Subdoligranulum sp.]|uniref:hypothetical protein n=1 Tax=uncultured Subdoligranulum sp. TaxID=512298 RepID=UPI002627F63D
AVLPSIDCFALGIFLPPFSRVVLHSARGFARTGPRLPGNVPVFCPGHTARKTLLHSFIVPKNNLIRKGFLFRMLHRFSRRMCAI